tara:strand:- start:2766 stop:3185 length:420 start_codon:yes stop_codon:yes gene_type:complete
MNSIITQGMSKTVINNQLVEDKQYMGSYDGEKGKLLMRSGNEGVYVELDNNDLANMFNNKQFGEKNKKPIDKKLKSLLKKHRTLKNPVAGKKKKRKTRNKKKKKKQRKRRQRQTKRKRKRRRKIRSSYKKMITPKNRLL